MKQINSHYSSLFHKFLVEEILNKWNYSIIPQDIDTFFYSNNDLIALIELKRGKSKTWNSFNPPNNTIWENKYMKNDFNNYYSLFKLSKQLNTKLFTIQISSEEMLVEKWILFYEIIDINSKTKEIKFNKKYFNTIKEFLLFFENLWGKLEKQEVEYYKEQNITEKELSIYYLFKRYFWNNFYIDDRNSLSMIIWKQEKISFSYIEKETEIGRETDISILKDNKFLQLIVKKLNIPFYLFLYNKNFDFVNVYQLNSWKIIKYSKEEFKKFYINLIN